MSNFYRVLVTVVYTIANLIILLLGAGVLSIGVVGVVLVNDVFSASDYILFANTFFIVVTFIGVFITLLCLLAIVGTYATYCSNENSVLKGVAICLLVTATSGMLIMLIGQFIGVLVAYIYRAQLEDTFTSSVLTFFDDTYENNPRGIDEVIIPIQKFFDCCGATGPEDYAGISEVGLNNSLPEGCCRFVSPNCTLGGDSSLYRSEGCAMLVVGLIVAYFDAILGVGVAILVVSIIAVVMPLFLMCCIAFTKSDGVKF